MTNLPISNKIDALGKIYSQHNAANLVDRDLTELKRLFLSISVEGHSSLKTYTTTTKKNVKKYLLKRYPPNITAKIMQVFRFG